MTCDFLSRARSTSRLSLLVLAYAYDALEALDWTTALGDSHIDYGQLGGLVDTLVRLIPWYEPPRRRESVTAILDSIKRAIYVSPADSKTDVDRGAFEQLAAAVTPLVDFWNNKRVLFLLDDVSRHLTPTETFELFDQALVPHAMYAFKVSAETLTMEIHSPGGPPALSGRDYRVFDLGQLVLDKLGGSQGVEFVDTVLYVRATCVDGPQERPRYVLGTNPLVSIARRIGDPAGSHDDIYWGINALAAMCCGDIGDIILLYSRITNPRSMDKAPELPLESRHQHKVIVEFAKAKLKNLYYQRDGERMHRHAIEFAKASHLKLGLDKPGARPSQYGEIQLDLSKLAPAEEAEVKTLATELVQHGVFVVEPEVQRSKASQASIALEGPRTQLRLMFTKILGLGHLIPLGRRGRFELPYRGYGILEWLKEPSAERLLPAAVEEDAGPEIGEDAADSSGSEGRSELEVPIGTLRNADRQLMMSFASDRSPASSSTADQGGSLVPLVEARELRDWLKEVDWPTTGYIGAFGFEDRSVGVWRYFQRHGVAPLRATMVEYDRPGKRADIEAVLAELDCPWTSAKRDEEQGAAESYALFARRLLVGAESCAHLLIDTTALTKPLIYELVRQSLSIMGPTLVLHASAQFYPPSDSDLAAVLPLEESDVRRELDRMVGGEQGPFTFETVADQPRDPGAPNVLVAFIPLKFRRVETILADLNPTVIEAIASMHSSGEKAVRSVVGRLLADGYSTAHGGETHECGALDISATYSLLRDLYRRHALEQGHNFDLSLTGSKLHTVATAMMAWAQPVSGVYYSRPSDYNESAFSMGTGEIQCYRLIPSRNGTT